MVEANEETVAESFEKALNEGCVGPCTVVVTGDSTATKIRLGSQRCLPKPACRRPSAVCATQIYLKMIYHKALSSTENAQKAMDF